jgi:hypothetical protein
MKSREKALFEGILLVAIVLAAVAMPLAARADSHMPHQPPAFTDFDLDGDGFVSEEEFNTTRAARHEAMAKEGRPMKGMASAPAFSDIDADGDGRLSEAELTAAQQAHMKAMHGGHGGKHKGHRCPMHHGGRMPAFEDIDTDGDGCISPAEFDAHHAPKDDTAG